MSVKILGGVCKGINLAIPLGSLRPTGVLLKRRFFDRNQVFEQKIFVDLCCGSGAIGLEALSRGAMSLIFVEKNKDIIKGLKKNVSIVSDAVLKIRKNFKVQVVNASFNKWIKTFKDIYSTWPIEEKTNTIIYFDPPYHEILLYKNIVDDIINLDWFCGDLWIEYEKGNKILESLNSDIIKKTFKQGDNIIILI